MRIIKEVLAYNVKGLRKDAGMTQEQLAERAFVSPAAIQRIEWCDRWPEETTVRGIAAALNVPETRLFADPSLKPSTIEAWEVITEKLGLEGSLGAIKRRLKALDSEHEKKILNN